MTKEEPSLQQQKLIEIIKGNRNALVTGGAGTGKSWLLRHLKEQQNNNGTICGKTLDVVASTGIAAINIGGSTVHSWAGIGIGDMPIETILDNLDSFRGSKARKRILSAQILAIDEISMISSYLLDMLDKVFRAIRRNDEPMGGIKVVLFGDFLQLPPVSKYNASEDRDLSKSDFCFKSEVWAKLNLATIILQETFRQKDKEFVKLLNNLRLNRLESADKAILESRIIKKEELKNLSTTILTTHNQKAELINQQQLEKIKNPSMVFEAKYEGKPDKITFLQKNCLAKELLNLKIGTQVMMIKNTYQKDGIINGSTGVVTGFSIKKNYPIVKFGNDKVLTIIPEEWVVETPDPQKKTVVIEAKMTQIPLILAWAITIHKSQGLTIDRIYCNLEDSFAAGQIYVALSRCKSLDDLHIENINFNKINANQEVVSFYDSLTPS